MFNDGISWGILHLFMKQPTPQTKESRAYPKGYFGAEPSRRSAQGQTVQVHAFSPYKKHLFAFINGLPKGARVLDLGCGSGKTAHLMQFLRPDIHVEACDLSDVARFLPDSVPFAQCSAEEAGMHYKEGSFDAVICQHVIEHLQSPLGLMGSVRRILRKGGTLFLETPNWPRLFIPFSSNFFWNDYTHVRLYPKFALIKLMLEHEFGIHEVTTCSSFVWFRPRVPSVEEDAPEHAPAAVRRELRPPYKWNLPVTRVFARLINPLIRDILIVVARKL